MTDIKKLEEIATQIRRDIVRMVHKVQSGHPGGSLGCTDYFVALFFEVLNHNQDTWTIEGTGHDIFVLSNGHISPVYYSALARSGYFPIQELNTFRHLDSRLQGHPTTHEGLPGIHIATGSLGQGMSAAIGMALGKKLANDENVVFSLHGDGELQEGQNWEALMFAPHNKVDNLIITIDYNGQQIDGATKDVLNLGNLKDKLTSFGWEVLEMDGHNLREIVETLNNAKANTYKGVCQAIIMKTEMGQGIDFMVGTHKWHGVAPNDEQLGSALNQLPLTIGDY
ncbi:MAG: transketolase [Bacteroidota bacterium]|nr:transketolase [Bacteroidota bacterium]